MPISINIDPAVEMKDLVAYLVENKVLLNAPARCSIEVPGEGNMNAVIRLNYDGKSVIVKQSKEYVNKYPSIPAPPDRIFAEASFFQLAKEIPTVADMGPEILLVDPNNFLIVMEDLGVGTDYTFIYQPQNRLLKNEIDSLLNYLHALHKQRWTADQIQDIPSNLELRKLNHQHIFSLPFEADNGFDLDAIQNGLANLAQRYQNDVRLKARATELGKLYLGSGKALIHGDFYPGSWLRVGREIKVIDPEFCFLGPPEFDLGVMLAHLMMAGENWMDVHSAIIDQTHYRLPLEFNVLQEFTGIEVMRRLIGLAQLPLHLSLREKEILLADAHEMVRSAE